MSEPTLLDDEFQIEPDEPAFAIEPEEPENTDPRAMSPEPSAPEPAALAPLVEVLGADFPLPRLIRFCPDPRLKLALDQAVAYALAVNVSEPDGLMRADVALATVRTSLKAIAEHFEEPKDLANRVHKRITTTLSDWCEPGDTAVRTVGRRIAVEQSRLAQIAAEARRKAQEEEDRKARELARKKAEDAAKQKAPAPVVEQMRREAETVTAPPVPPAASEPAPLRSSTVVKPWKARVAGSPADAEPNPEIGEMTPAQLAQVKVLLKAILEDRAPLTAIEINWSTLNARAKSDKSTLAIPGIEAFQDVGVRAKGSRVR